TLLSNKPHCSHRFVLTLEIHQNNKEQMFDMEAESDEQKEITQRPKWDNKIQYLLTCIGFAVGLGNVWRVPYLCQSYGGGKQNSFLIPYVIALVFEGLPLLHMELAIGQWLRIGSVGVWSVQSPHIRESPLPWRDCPVNLNHTEFIQTFPQQAIYATATFPYLVLTIFLIRALTLPGTSDDLIYLFTPNWEPLKNPKVWLDAATQIFFSLSLAFGGLIAFSSYNPQKNNCERDALIVGCVNSFTSIYASVPIFAILSFKSASGTGLAFILFTEAVIEMSASQVWVLFFVMLFCLGLSSMFGNLEGVLTPLLDLHIFIVTCLMMSDILLTGLICLISFAVALIFTLGSGNYWLEIFNSYVGSVPLLNIAFFEIIAVAFIFGINRFNDDIEWMTGRRPNIYWQAMWRFISPFMLLVVFVAYVVIEAEKQPTYNVHFPLADVLHYPEWVFVICVLLSILPVVSIPLVAFYKFMCFLKNYTMNRQSKSILSSR
uniref:Solute carrier family 6 member 18 n=1 Tax=Pundamilia nyererei TaxID=303518 RepID=A0A3B4G6T4_9CICH